MFETTVLTAASFAILLGHRMYVRTHCAAVARRSSLALSLLRVKQCSQINVGLGRSISRTKISIYIVYIGNQDAPDAAPPPRALPVSRPQHNQSPNNLAPRNVPDGDKHES